MTRYYNRNDFSKIFIIGTIESRNLRIENNLIISASSIKEIVGGSCRLRKFIYKKQSIIQITNNDNLCALCVER